MTYGNKFPVLPIDEHVLAVDLPVTKDFRALDPPGQGEREGGRDPIGRPRVSPEVVQNGRRAFTGDFLTAAATRIRFLVHPSSGAQFLENWWLY